MAIITLTSDLGTKDAYLPAIKGSIYSQLENVTLVDISNDIDAFNISQAAYVLRNCFKDFPFGTIHIISVDDEISVKNEHLVVQAHGHFFIGADNGLFPLLFNEVKPEKIVRLNISQDSDCVTFAAKNIFVPAACHLARGGTMEMIGVAVTNYEVNKTALNAVKEKDTIRGIVVYVDHYGNAITNISKHEFEQVRKGREFAILFGREDEKITKISEKYKNVFEGDRLAIFGENKQLQIAMNQGKANTLLGLGLHSIIRVEFK